MSQANVTVTPTVKISNPNTIVINTGYLKTASGLLKILQLILGAVAIWLLFKSYDDYPYYYDSRSREPCFGYCFEYPLYLKTTATASFILTALLLLSCMFSLSTGGFISKPLFEFLYHLLAAILLLCTSIMWLGQLSYPEIIDFSWRSWYSVTLIVCCINSFLYLASAVLAFREYRKRQLMRLGHVKQSCNI